MEAIIIYRNKKLIKKYYNKNDNRYHELHAKNIFASFEQFYFHFSNLFSLTQQHGILPILLKNLFMNQSSKLKFLIIFAFQIAHFEEVLEK